MKRFVLATVLLLLCNVYVCSQQYFPEGRAFVCVNGSNRFTRALYGGPTEWRLETSDRPVFAIFKKKDYRNVSFYVNGVRLDSTAYCKSAYENAQRRYELSDRRWGNNARLLVNAVASMECEKTLWQFCATGFDRPVVLSVRTSAIANERLSRNGDIGVDPEGCFEASDRQVRRYEFGLAGSSVVSIENMDECRQCDAAEYDEACRQAERLCSRVVFDTPDPWLNTLGGALVAAADGIWDGQTWLHGAVWVAHAAQ